jgi:DNA-binding MarR family transcriptional regulator
MDAVSDTDPDQMRRKRRLHAAVRESLRDMSIQLSLLNHYVGGRLGLKGTDLECFALIEAHAPVTPSELARLSGLHPATMTGILDRLERGGWIARDRDSVDRRGVKIRPLETRVADVTRLYSGMAVAMDEICAEYDEGELARMLEFLRRATDAGRGVVADMAERGASA